MVSTKFYNDYDETEVFINNWAYEGEISLERLKQLEIDFLNKIQWELLVSDNEFYEKLKTVETLLAQKEGLTRNWFTYTELDLLMPKINLVKQIAHYLTVLMFTYACSVLTIALSSIILTSIPPLQITNDLGTTQCPNVTTTALLPNDKRISIDNNQTECTFDFNVNDLLLEKMITDEACCNFTIDVPLLSNDIDKFKAANNEKFYFGFFQKHHNPVPLVW